MMITIKQNMEVVDYLQIGSHEGNSENDHLFHSNLQNKNIILVEPIPHIFEKLKDNYVKKHCVCNNIIFENIAISNKDGQLDLYMASLSNDFSKHPYYATQLASTNPEHIPKHLGGLVSEKIVVPCLTLNSFIKKHNIRSIDYLMIDTEGHDYDILMGFDFSILKPSRIKFENKHMDGVWLRGERYSQLLEYLALNGYKKVREDTEDTDVVLEKN